MKRILFVMAVLLTAGCNSISADHLEAIRNSTTTRVIDGCEYLETNHNLILNNATYSLTHKGNCKNPIHIYRGDK